MTVRTCGNVVELDLTNDITIYVTVDVTSLKVDYLDDSRIARCPLPPSVQTSMADTPDVVQSIADHLPSSEGTGWEYEVK